MTKGQHGGPRPNSGRPKGSATFRTSEHTAALLQKGIQPIDVLLLSMRYYWQKAQEFHAEGNEAEAMRNMNSACDLAVDAAPYCHPRLAQVKHDGETDNKLQIVLQKEDADL